MTDPTGTILGSTDGVVRSSEQGGRSDALLPAPQVQNHAANLAFLPDNSLGCVWFAGTQEGVPDISVWFSALAPGSDQWSTPVQLSDDPSRSEQNPILHVVDDRSCGCCGPPSTPATRTLPACCAESLQTVAAPGARRTR